ncbi:MAG: DUF58 domain-containing protein [Firmicutes bacterium]|nr:DUF58 domain-containing protein [Bacillota bacterium]
MDRTILTKVILCAVTVGICLVPAIFINTILGYLAVLTAVVLIGGSYGYLRLLRRSLDYAESSDMSNCVRGTNIDFSVRLRNRSILFYPLVEPYFYIADLFGSDDSLISDIITLAPREKRDFEFDARFDHIGMYSAGLRKICLQDLLGLFTCTIESSREYTVSVIPQIYDIERLPVSRTAASESQKMTVANPMDSSDYAGVREYVIGDPIKNIHWKLSARTTGYMTKVFESYSNTGICVILDFHAPAYDPEGLMSVFDCIVETALSIGRYAVKEGLESEIRYYNKYGEKVQVSSYNQEEFISMVENMPRIHTEADRDRAVDLLREEGNSLYSQGNLIICTADITPELLESLIAVRTRRKNPMLFAVVPESLSEEKRQKLQSDMGILEEYGIFHHMLSDAKSLEGGSLS